MFRLDLIKRLSLCHIMLITVSNILVQYPFTVFKLHTTWGAITYPAIFILTDLTVRLFSANTARKIIFCSMLPGLMLSYLIASMIEEGWHLSWSSLFVLHTMPLRIAGACFIAYVVGQLMDIFVFRRYQRNTTWWLAPTISTTIGNVIDTFLFFSIAFYHCSNPFLSQHWPQIAMVDMCFKISISLLAFVPAYGFLLNVRRASWVTSRSL